MRDVISVKYTLDFKDLAWINMQNIYIDFMSK